MLTAEAIKQKARELGADAVGIASAETLNAFPPDPEYPQIPANISPDIVLAKRTLSGTARLVDWDERHKQYAAELTLSQLEEASLKLVYFLEDEGGHPALIIPPMHTDATRNYEAYMAGGTYGPR